MYEKHANAKLIIKTYKSIIKLNSNESYMLSAKERVMHKGLFTFWTQTSSEILITV